MAGWFTGEERMEVGRALPNSGAVEVREARETEEAAAEIAGASASARATG